MSKDSLQETYDCYLSAFSDVSAEERERLLRRSVANDVVFMNPKGGSQGFEALVAHIGHFQKQSPEAYFRNKKLLTHHDHFLSEWTLYKKDGSELATAHTYGRFNEQGLLTNLIGFF